MATSNRDFDNATIVEGVKALKEQYKVITENVTDVRVSYDAPAEAGGPGYATVWVTTAHVVVQEEADEILKRALK